MTKIPVKRETHAKYKQAKQLTGLRFSEIAEIAVADFLGDKAQRIAEARMA